MNTKSSNDSPINAVDLILQDLQEVAAIIHALYQYNFWINGFSGKANEDDAAKAGATVSDRCDLAEAAVQRELKESLKGAEKLRDAKGHCNYEDMAYQFCRLAAAIENYQMIVAAVELKWLSDENRVLLHGSARLLGQRIPALLNFRSIAEASDETRPLAA